MRSTMTKYQEPKSQIYTLQFITFKAGTQWRKPGVSALNVLPPLLHAPSISGGKLLTLGPDVDELCRQGVQKGTQVCEPRAGRCQGIVWYFINKCHVE